jgi:hypothetical protein
VFDHIQKLDDLVKAAKAQSEQLEQKAKKVNKKQKQIILTQAVRSYR